MGLFLHRIQNRFGEIKPKKVWYISSKKVYVRFITFLWAEKSNALFPKAKFSLSRSAYVVSAVWTHTHARTHARTHTHTHTHTHELSKKETSPHIQLLLFPANFWTRVNICITLRHKLNMFHRHLTNRNGIMSPKTKEGSISKISCVHQLLWALNSSSHSHWMHDLPVLPVRCFSTLPARRQQVLKHIWGSHG